MSNIPKGAGLGQDNPNRLKRALIDYEWAMQHGSRAQRREIVRLLKMHQRQGHPEAAGALADLTSRHGSRDGAPSMVWRICLPNRTPFCVICPQLATASEIAAQWPGAIVEAVHE